MDNYEQLVKALRYCAESGDFKCGKDCPMHTEYPNCLTKMDTDAAAAIEALLKENKELIEDHPEMVEVDGHWEWRKPNGEVLMPKRGDGCDICRNGTLEEGDTLYKSSDWDGGIGFDYIRDIRFCPICGKKLEVQE